MAHSKPRFETKVSELETIAKKMEQGDLTLEEALSYFEKGVTLAKECQEALAKATQKVQQLTEAGEITGLSHVDNDA